MSIVRDLSRCTKTLAEAKARIAEMENELRHAKETVQVAERAQKQLAGDVAAEKRITAQERVRRVSAQRGLVAYMREHGLADRIGYDPDDDPQVSQDIRDGLIPPLGLSIKTLLHPEGTSRSSDLRELAAALTTTKSRSAGKRLPRAIRRRKAR